MMVITFDFFVFLLFFTHLVWFFTFFFLFYWKMKIKFYQRAVSPIFTNYQFFTSLVSIHYKTSRGKAHYVEKLSFQKTLPFVFEKELSWDIFATFLDKKHSAKKVTALLCQIWEKAQTRKITNDFTLSFQIIDFRQKYKFSFLKLDKNTILAVFTNWL